MPNKLAALVKFLHFLLHTYSYSPYHLLPTLLCALTSFTIGTGPACAQANSARQSSEMTATKFGHISQSFIFLFTLLFFSGTFSFALLLKYFPSISLIIYFFLLSFFLFISVNFLRHALSISCSLSLLLLCCFRSCCLYKVQRRNVEPLLPLNAIYMRQSADAAPALAAASCVCRSHNSNTRSSARKLRFVIVTLSLFLSLGAFNAAHPLQLERALSLVSVVDCDALPSLPLSLLFNLFCLCPLHIFLF